MKLLPLAAAALLAVPAIAQPARPAPQNPPRDTMQREPMQRGPMFGNMSTEGRKQLLTAMHNTPEERAAAKAARDRIDALVAADTLDSAALKRAMDDERKLMDTQRARRQAAMLAAIEKLSAADRKAFAASAGRARAQVEARTNDWRNRSMPNHGQPKAAPKN